ncbi:FliM/FliN family flagellar motor switch protein [Phenylobacterium zucineum]|uniref:FliM/FliN family flagellar motor switch protein n=1 Tax=Phenylobacterium zucineum TaxID=284016 RepID=UPI001C860DE2
MGPLRAKPLVPLAWSDPSVSQVKAVNVEIQVVLGRASLPMQQLLRMGRGAVIPLDATVNEEVWILANNHPVARGEIQISDDKIAIAVTREANVYDYMAGGA